MSKPAFVCALDHELYFGTRPGSIDRCLIEPVDALLRATDRFGFKLTLFVDAGMLPALRAAGDDQTFKQVASHLKSIFDQGHDVQLHIHPHWEDSSIVGGTAEFDTTRYRLHDFPPADIRCVVGRYKHELETIIEAPVTAYRAGGWCIQPFNKLADALFDHGVTVDSTVYAGGFSADRGREYDFRAAPDTDHWRFEDEPGTPNPAGRFLELPITPVTLSPWFYLQNEVLKRTQPEQHGKFGDGEYLAHDSSYYLEKLKPRSVSPASVDGYKASRLQAAYRRVMARRGNLLNVMGHPKAISRASIDNIVNFLERNLTEPQTMRSVIAQI